MNPPTAFDRPQVDIGADGPIARPLDSPVAGIPAWARFPPLAGPRIIGALRFAVVVCGVGAVAFVPRLATARAMAWLNDEIVFVDWLGYWFSQHGLAYIFQWQHTLYPPMSPIFANPPLFPLIVGLALNLAGSLAIPPLLAARLVSLIAGMATCGVVAWIGHRLWGGREAFLAAAFLAILPVAVVASATAYVEGLLALEVSALLALLVAAERSPRWRFVAFAALVSGFGILTKLSFLPFVGGAAIILLGCRVSERRGLRTGAYVLLTGLVPVVCWAGARDPHHIAGVIAYVSGVRPNDGLTQTFPPWQLGWYYPGLVLGTLPDVLFVALALGVAVGGYRFVRRGARDRWLLALGALAILYVGFITISIGPSSRHQIAALEPLVALIAARLIAALLRVTPLPELGRGAIALGILGGSLLPLMQLPPGAYNAFSNTFVGGTAGSRQDYLSGDGEEMDRAGTWLNANTPPGTVIATVAENYNLQKYLLDDRRTVALFNYESLNDAGGRGASVVILYASQIWSGQETAVAASARSRTPAAVLTVADAPYMYVYNLAAEPRTRSPLQLTWTEFQRSPTGEVVSVSSNGPNDIAFAYQYVGTGLHWAGLVSEPFSLRGMDRLAMQLNVQSTSDSKVVFIDLLPSQEKPGEPYLRYVLPLAPVLMQGPPEPLNLEIPLTMFHWVDANGTDVAGPPALPDRPFQLRVVADSHLSAVGRVDVGNVAGVSVIRPPAH